jgi:hypothetical protein
MPAPKTRVFYGQMPFNFLLLSIPPSLTLCQALSQAVAKLDPETG